MSLWERTSFVSIFKLHLEVISYYIACTCLLYFTRNDHLYFLFCGWIWHYFLLLYVWEILHCVHHLYLLQLACFLDLAIVPCGAKIAKVPMSFKFWNTPEACPGMGLLGPIVVEYLLQLQISVHIGEKYFCEYVHDRKAEERRKELILVDYLNQRYLCVWISESLFML